jgi:hypothetical protein
VRTVANSTKARVLLHLLCTSGAGVRQQERTNDRSAHTMNVQRPTVLPRGHCASFLPIHTLFVVGDELDQAEGPAIIMAQ